MQRMAGRPDGNARRAALWAVGRPRPSAMSLPILGCSDRARLAVASARRNSQAGTRDGPSTGGALPDVGRCVLVQALFVESASAQSTASPVPTAIAPVLALLGGWLNTARNTHICRCGGAGPGGSRLRARRSAGCDQCRDACADSTSGPGFRHHWRRGCRGGSCVMPGTRSCLPPSRPARSGPLTPGLLI